MKVKPTFFYKKKAICRTRAEIRIVPKKFARNLCHELSTCECASDQMVNRVEESSQENDSTTIAKGRAIVLRNANKIGQWIVCFPDLDLAYVCHNEVHLNYLFEEYEINSTEIWSRLNEN